MRVIFTTEKPLDGELSLIAPDGSVAATSRDRLDGPPYVWFAEVAAPAAGTWHATLTRNNAPAECGKITRDIAVREAKPAPPSATPGSLWPMRNSWNRATENLFSAWIEKLFDAPLDAEPSWPALYNVLRDRSRNVLFNSLGLGEDEIPMALKPDCTDMVYYLRAYFAFKMGLPFGYSKCSRGGGGTPPKCYQWFSIQNPDASRPVSAKQKATSGEAAAKQPGLAASFARYLPVVGDAVQSGAVRTLASDDNTDFYTVPLTQETLRPGTIYADPYGHVLMLVRRVPQVGGGAGVFLAVDAEPDGSVTRKRFWRGNFLFVHDPTLGSPGFKRFRPIVRGENGGLRRLTNAEIAKNPQYGDFSLEQSKLGVEDFYDRMDEVMSPAPLDPVAGDEGGDHVARRADQDARHRGRERAQVPEQRQRRGGMPDGPAIFETTGPWEDFSTPARDFRLLIAIDVVRGYPDRVARRPERYAMPKDKSVADVKAELQSVLASELGGAQVYLYAQRRLAVDAVAQGRPRPFGGAGDVLQPERLRRTALGRAGQERRGVDVQAACAGGAARQDDEVPHLVPRAALAGARLSGRRLVTKARICRRHSRCSRARRLLWRRTIRSALDRLVAAYPDALAGHDGKTLRWRDGTVDADRPEAAGQDVRGAAAACVHRRSVSPPLPARPAAKSRRPSMPIRAVSATPPFSRRCTATAKRARCRRTSYPYVWLPKTWGNQSASRR